MSYFIKRNISTITEPIFNQIFLKNNDVDTATVTFMCAGIHFSILDSCLLYMDESHKSVIYLRFTALVINDVYFYYYHESGTLVRQLHVQNSKFVHSKHGIFLHDRCLFNHVNDPEMINKLIGQSTCK